MLSSNQISGRKPTFLLVFSSLWWLEANRGRCGPTLQSEAKLAPASVVRVVLKSMAGNRESIIERVSTIAERVGAAHGIELVNVEFLGGGRNRVLRLYIDRPPADGGPVPVGAPSGVSLEDCELISHQVGIILDEQDVIPGEGYQLEVSSPGVERKLFRLEDFSRFAGHPAKVTLKSPVDEKAHWQGVLKGVDGGLIRLESGGRTVEFPFDQVAKANLKFRW